MKIKLLVNELRIKKGISIRELAQISGVSKSQIERMDKNVANPTLGVLVKLSRALNVDISELFIVEEEE